MTATWNARLILTMAGLLVLAAVSSAQPAPSPKAEIVDVSGAPAIGAGDAPVTLVIFADVSAPAAGGLGVIVHGLVERYPVALRICFRHSPAADQPDHVLANRAAIAAGEQGKFWPMLDLLLANQSRQGSEHLAAMAAQLGLDTARFSEDIDSVTAHQRIDADQQQAAALKIGATPTFFVNGVRLSGAKSLTELAAQIDADLSRRGGR